MERKPLSMKKLHQYVIDYLEERYPRDEYFRQDLAEKNLTTLKEFLDYIWKNPK